MRKIALGLTLLSTNVMAAQYLCTVEQSTGFRYSEAEKNWVSTRFAPDEKYTLSDSAGKYELRTSGFDKPVATCGGFNEAGVISCDGWIVLVFYKKSGRFTAFSEGSFHAVGSKFFPVDSTIIPNPSVSIGKCIKFS